MDNITGKAENQAVFENETKNFPIQAPEILRALDRWVIHSKKVPFTVKKGKLVKVNPAKAGVNFLSFDQAVKARETFANESDGLGFVLDKNLAPLVCIDVDGRENPFIARLMGELGDTYIEKSPSENGYHFWYIDHETDGLAGRRIKNLEIYTAKRFMTFTGNKIAISNNELATHDGLTRALLLELFDTEEADRQVEEVDFDEPPSIPDADMLAIIQSSRDIVLQNLLADISTGAYHSPSEADWHCVLKLCFWTGGNAGQIERLITESALGKRDKWQDRKDYRRLTITRALAVWDGTAFKGNRVKGLEIRQGDKSLFVDKDGKPRAFKTPRGYSISEGKGIYKTDEEDKTDKCITNDMILPLRLFVNADTQEVSADVWYRRQNRWHHTVFGNDVLSSTKAIVELSKYGLNINSINARAMVAFLCAFKAANQNIIEHVTAYSQTGWRQNGEFIYPVKTERYFIDAGREVDVISLYTPQGDRDSWLAVYNSLKCHKFFRLAVAASLAAPLLNILRLRNMTLHFWSQSGNGKTAILKFADSIFKNPLPLLKFNASASFMEARCTTLSDFPLCVDELKTADHDGKIKTNIDVFAHFIEGGASRGRATKEVNQRLVKLFRTIAITTGERPLTDFASDMGIKRRTLEIHADKIFPDNLNCHGQPVAAFLHRFAEDNYALVGKEWIDTITGSAVQDEIIDVYQNYQRRITAARPDAFIDHCNLLAACATADFFFNREIADPDNTPDSDILLELEECFNEESAEKDSRRAFKAIVEWLQQNHGYFIDVNAADMARPVTFGWITDKDKPEEAILVIPRVLQKMLKDDGFAPKKVLTELAEECLIMSQLQKGRNKPDYAIVQRIKGVGVCRVIKLHKQVVDDFIQRDAAV